MTDVGVQNSSARRGALRPARGPSHGRRDREN